MNTIQIRRLRATDSFDELTSLLHRAFAPLGRLGLQCTGVDQSVDTTSRRAHRGDCFVALADARIVGTMTLEGPERGSPCRWYRRPEVASVHQFAVDPLYQGQGCGKALLREAEHWARKRGYGELALETPLAAEDLVSYYQARGFKPVEQMQKPDKNYLSVVLSKTVSRLKRPASLWYSPHRAMWCGTLVRH